MKNPFLRRLSEKVIIADGAMGTAIQNRDLSPDDFGGLDGCNEYLVETKPEIIKEIHASYLEVGADLIETNSFGSSALVLAEYDIADQAYALSKKSAKLAKEVSSDFSSSSWPRFVSGSVGPTTKLLTLQHIGFDGMYKGYLPHIAGLIDGGVDLLQIETSQDILQLKCAVIAARAAMKQCGREVPIGVTFTVEAMGTMLVGTEVSAALTVLETLPVDFVGMNCATGPDLMQENIRFLGQTSSRPIAVLPNAGLPRNEGGRAVYDLTPEDLGEYQEMFVKDYGVALVGGCCGTTPAHIEELYQRVGSIAPRERPFDFDSHVSSTFVSVPLDQDGSSPLIVGERCNANGSKKFREILLAEDWEAAVDMGRHEVTEGAHVLDVCTAYVGRNEVQDMSEIIERFASQITAPLMIDSTQVDVLEAALKRVGGRPIINSINLEDGEEKLNEICRLAVDYGAALVALTIDEEGMAKSAERKLAVAQRIYELCQAHGIPGEAILYDPLTFTIASGDEESRNAGIETLKGIELIKQHIPRSRTILGVSNISFGLKPYPRQILNSVFLAEALSKGLDACIVHSKKILPVHQIDEELRRIALDLVYDRRKKDYDPLFVFVEKLQGAKGKRQKQENLDDGPVEEVLQRRIVDGEKQGIEKQLDRARETYSPLDIINKILLEGMKTVGELFASGEMQLPFVLQSAETMKKSVGYLQQYMDKDAGPAKGKMVIATVKGDVHDIGKNLVDIILSNNGYEVTNLGIKQPVEAILQAVDDQKPDAVGLSGLLVKSTLVMKENLELMSERGYSVPVVCGGAALNKAYVEVDLRKAYSTGPVFYGLDAFTGLRIMDELTGQVEEKRLTGTADEKAVRRGKMRFEKEERIAEKSTEYVKTETKILESIPEPPFWGVRHLGPEDINVMEVLPYINRKALFANQWQYRRGKRSTREYRKFLKEHVEPLFNEWCQKAVEHNWLRPAIAYGYFPCQSEKNDLLVFDPQDHEKEFCRISFPRQTTDKRRCISDYFLPRESGRKDVIAFHVVTSGAFASEKCQELFQNNQYSDYLHFYGLSVETAEALAEYWHKRIRHEMHIDRKDALTIDALFRQTYQGERYSFGYPACPNLEDQKYIFELLRPEKIGVTLTSEFQLNPEQATSAIIVHHPEACYFSL